MVSVWCGCGGDECAQLVCIWVSEIGIFTICGPFFFVFCLLPFLFHDFVKEAI